MHKLLLVASFATITPFAFADDPAPVPKPILKIAQRAKPEVTLKVGDPRRN